MEYTGTSYWRKKKPKRKTHCRWGHPLSGDNVRVTDRCRVCLTCAKRWKERSKENRGAYDKTSGSA